MAPKTAVGQMNTALSQFSVLAPGVCVIGLTAARLLRSYFNPLPPRPFSLQEGPLASPLGITL